MPLTDLLRDGPGDLAPVNDNGVHCYGVRWIKIYIMGGRLVTISTTKILPENSCLCNRHKTIRNC